MSERLSSERAFLVLNGLPNVGPVTINRLLAAFGGDPAAVLGAHKAALAAVDGVTLRAAEIVAGWATHVDPVAEERRMAEGGADFVPRCSPCYPKPLLDIHDPPSGLYRIGNYDFSRPAVAIIGSRRCTRYGLDTARAFGAGLARAGFCVVSGLARGIDAAAHAGALDANGITVAVLGNGVDIVYPAENRDLYRRIPEKGAVLSEFCLGRTADKQSFAMRNRLVSGMSRAVVVIESDTDGGSMITARFALDQGRSVCALPGRIDQSSSRGCHQLIREGATLVSSVDEILSEINYLQGLCPLDGMKPVARSMVPAPADPTEAGILACLADGALLSPEHIALRLGLSVQVVNAGLLMLELSHRATRRTDGCYEVIS
jgi:DNA processing protein